MTKTCTYTCTGSVRGGCGHKHRTIEAAIRCCRADQRDCKDQGGYSDRQPRNSDGSRLSETDYLYSISPDCRA